MKSLSNHKQEYALSNIVKSLVEGFKIKKCRKNAKSTDKY